MCTTGRSVRLDSVVSISYCRATQYTVVTIRVNRYVFISKETLSELSTTNTTTTTTTTTTTNNNNNNNNNIT